jgi:hypothetical protein
MNRRIIPTAAFLVVLGCTSGAALADKHAGRAGAQRQHQQTRERARDCAATPAELVNSEIAVDEVVAIQISPRTLIIGAPVPSVTVHADIPFALVAGDTVELNGIPATATFADDRGDLVAKFPFTEIESLATEAGGSDLTLLLTGVMVDSQTFGGEAVVAVRSIGKR